MMNYRIKVEAINPDVKVDRELLEGMECEGFFMGLDRGDISTVVIQKLTAVGLAGMIAKDTNMLEAAIIAQGIDKARMMRRDRETPKAQDLMAVLMNGLSDDERRGGNEA